MTKDSIIKYSKKMLPFFEGKNSPKSIHYRLTNDKMLKEIPLSFREGIVFSFLIFIEKMGWDSELFYDEINNNLFVAVIDSVESEGVRIPCDFCYGDGYVQCDTCGGDGQVDCDDCDGSGEVEDENGIDPCDTCQGGGSLECSTCEGSGEEMCYECYGSGSIDDLDMRKLSVWEVYSYDKDIFRKLELMDADTKLSSVLFDDIWDSDKSLPILNVNEFTIDDPSLSQGDHIFDSVTPF